MHVFQPLAFTRTTGPLRTRKRWGGGAAYCVLLLATVLSSVGCASLSDAEKESLRVASAEYERGEISSAMARLDKLIADHPSTKEIAEAYYVRGLCHARAGQYGTAQRDLLTALKNSNRDDLTAHTRASLGAVAYRQGDWGRAAEYYEAALPDLPDDPPKDQTLYYAGVALERIGQWKRARARFAEILHRFGTRPIAASARRKAAWKHQFFAIQLGAYSSTQNADRAIATLKADGYDVWQEFSSRDGGAVWLVLTGRYSTYAEAVRALKHIRTTQSDALIVP